MRVPMVHNVDHCVHVCQLGKMTKVEMQWAQGRAVSTVMLVRTVGDKQLRVI